MYKLTTQEQACQAHWQGSTPKSLSHEIQHKYEQHTVKPETQAKSSQQKLKDKCYNYISDINCIHSNKCLTHCNEQVLKRSCCIIFTLQHSSHFRMNSILSQDCCRNRSLSIPSTENAPGAKDTSCTAYKKVKANTSPEYTALPDYIIYYSGNHENAKFSMRVLLRSSIRKQQQYHSFLFYDL